MPPGNDVIVGIDRGRTSLRVLVVDGRNRLLAGMKAPTRPARKPSKLIEDLAALVEDAGEAGPASAPGRRRTRSSP